MQDELRKIQQFISSPHCIFNFDSLDSPSIFHQRFIISYLSLRATFLKPHPHIIRELHSVSDRTLDSLAQGFLYCCLLDRKLFVNVLEYLMILRVEVWSALTKNLQILLADYPESIRPHCRLNFANLLTQILSYNVCTPEIIEYITKNISNYDFSEQTQIANKSIFGTFMSYLKDSQVAILPEIKGCISHYLFIKCCRLLGSPYHHECAQLMLLIWQKFPEDVQFFSQQISQMLGKFVTGQKTTLKQHSFIEDIDKVYDAIKDLQIHPQALRNEFDLYRQRVFGVLIDRKTENLLNFVIKEGLSYSELKTQIGWIQKKWQLQKTNWVPILLDIAQWTIFGSDLYQNRDILIDWINKKISWSAQGTLEQVRRIILSPILCKHPKISRCLSTLSFLRRVLQSEPKIASDYLIYLVKQADNYRDSIIHILTQANSHNLLRFDEIQKNQLVPDIVKSEIQKIMSGLVEVQQMQEVAIIGLGQKNSQQINYDNDGSDYSPIKVPTQIRNNPYFLILEQEFIGLFTNELTNVLDDPTYINFIEFFSKVCEVGVTIRKDKENRNFANIVCRETARVLYTAFNKQFEELKQIQPYQSSIIFHMLSVIGQDWHRVTHRLQMMKGIVKNIMDMFPVAQIAFWLYFFTYFEYGGANYRSVKSWLIPKEKSEFVIRAIQALTERQETDLRERAATYGIK